MTAVVETGNIIAQLPGAARRDRAERFAGLLRMALGTASPWAVSGVAWDRDFLQAMVDGAGPRLLPIVEFATVPDGVLDRTRNALAHPK